MLPTRCIYDICLCCNAFACFLDLSSNSTPTEEDLDVLDVDAVVRVCEEGFDRLVGFWGGGMLMGLGPSGPTTGTSSTCCSHAIEEISAGLLIFLRPNLDLLFWIVEDDPLTANATESSLLSSWLVSSAEVDLDPFFLRRNCILVELLIDLLKGQISLVSSTIFFIMIPRRCSVAVALTNRLL